MVDDSAAPTKRFSSRVENYVKFRPSYPPQVIDILCKETGLNSASVVADVGAGTGIFTTQLLQEGCLVYAVEPNEAMRFAADQAFASYNNYRSVNAPAEALPFDERSIDLVTAAQAFHWFNADGARREFSRVLRPGGFIALIWNARRLEQTPFLQAYEQLLIRYGTDYQRVRHENVGEAQLAAFFHDGAFQKFVIPHETFLGFDALNGRLLSSSYMPLPGTSSHEAVLAELGQLFETHAVDGKIGFHYDTEVCLGH